MTVTLSGLKISRESMARRFLLVQSLDAGHLAGVEFEFPRDYSETERRPGIVIDANGWASETLDNGEEIRWRFRFTKDTIKAEEIRGIALFCRGKLAQAPDAWSGDPPCAGYSCR